MNKRSLKVVGIMNGTSIDGADFVLTEVKKSQSKSKQKLLGYFHSKFPELLKSKLHLAAQHKMDVAGLAALHHELGQFYATELQKKSKKWKWDVIGVHGQTVFHASGKATLQIGEASYLKATFPKSWVVSDFRPLDMALGGQAAPLATLFHKEVLATHFPKNKTVAIQNLGGIGNVSFFGKKKTLSFDTGPANMLLDLATSYLTQKQMSYDKDGEMASRGIPVTGVIGEWFHHPFFQKRPPKSCGREEFGEVFFQRTLQDMKGASKEDILSTLTEFTAQSLKLSYEKFLPKMPEVLVLCGGGAHNPHLIHRIRFHLPKTKVMTSLELNWDPSTIEASAFALMAAYRIWNLPNHIPETTGARMALSLGKVL